MDLILCNLISLIVGLRLGWNFKCCSCIRCTCFWDLWLIWLREDSEKRYFAVHGNCTEVSPLVFVTQNQYLKSQTSNWLQRLSNYLTWAESNEVLGWTHSVLPAQWPIELSLLTQTQASQNEFEAILKTHIFYTHLWLAPKCSINFVGMEFLFSLFVCDMGS